VKEFAQRVFIAAMVISAVLLIAYAMEWLLLILAGVLLAILFRTAAAWLSNHTRLSFNWAIAIVLISTAMLLLGTVWEFGSTITAETDQLLSKLSEALATLQQHAQRYGNVRRLLSQSNLNLQEPTVSLVSATVWATAAVILVLFVAAYCSINPNMYIEGFLRFFPQKRRTQVRTVLTETGSALKWWVFGRLIAMAVVGVITAVGLVIVKVPMAFPLAFVATLLTFVPYVGAIASAIPALMIGFTVSTQTALYVALVFLIAHATEGYIVGPTIQRRFVYLPPALILANQFLMQVLVGIVGVALATPFLVVVMVLVERLYFNEEWTDSQEAA
jgi:predicted PurR-regulated permease PerM